MYNFLGQQETAPPDLLRQLPACYSGEFDACIDDFHAGKEGGALSAYCQKYQPFWKSTPGAVWDAAMEAIPVCPAPAAAEKSKNNTLWLLGAGAAGLFLGMMIR